MNAICAVSLAKHLRVVADAFCPLRSHSATEQLKNPADVIWINTMCAMSLAIHLKEGGDALRPLGAHHRY